MILNIISWIIFGLIVSAIAKFLVWGDNSHSIINTFLLGISGAIVGGFLGHLLFRSKDETTARYGSWIISFVGAIIFLAARYSGWII